MKHIPSLLAAAVAVFQASSAFTQPDLDLTNLLGFEPKETLTLPLPALATPISRPFRRLPLSFERNEGQADPAVRFQARGRGYLLCLESTEAVIVLGGPATERAERHGVRQSPTAFGMEGEAAKGPEDWRSPKPSGLPAVPNPPAAQFQVLRMSLVGARRDADIAGEHELPGKCHYFIGNDPARWRTNIPTFAKVRYREVYPGIDLVYYGNEGQLEYDFVVAPGADPGRIELAITGADIVEVDGNGDLRLEVAGRELFWRKPVVFQEVNGERVPVAGEYVLRPTPAGRDSGAIRHVGFRVAEYDRLLALVIDPVLAYSTYLGGGIGEAIHGIAVDSAGCAYVTGQTFSRTSYNGTPAPGSPFPTTPDAIRRGFSVIGAVFVAKFNPEGSQLLYSTVLCGNSPTWQSCWGTGIAVDGAGMAVIIGTLDGSTDFPTKNAVQPKHGGGFSESFVAKLNQSGSALVFSTFLGGNGYEWSPCLALDAESNIHVAGQTSSRNFPTVSALQTTYGGGPYDAYVARLNADGTQFAYSTFLGGVGSESPPKLAVDPFGRARIALNVDGDHSGLLAGFRADGSALEYSKSLPGLVVNAIAVDRGGAVYLTGTTTSDALPTTLNAFQPGLAGGADAFAAKLSGVDPSFEYLTYVGGIANDVGYAIAVAADGSAYVGGNTQSADLPTAEPIQAENKSPGPSGGNAFVFKINAQGTGLEWATYLGGVTIDGPQLGRDVIRAATLSGDGTLYVAGSTASADFPVVNAFQENLDTSDTAEDAFIAKISEPQAASPFVSITRAGKVVAISWPVSATGFALETAEALGGSPSWTPEPTAPAIVGDQNVVTLEVGAAQFFRLKRP